ncbi:hypothetical protein [Modestobacter sp. SSW1-42]|uniref:hypothetical protein n=1 Tax=Modestobacter sp. SSW1-42 TaxID=596372 RepID=UPI0039863EA6
MSVQTEQRPAVAGRSTGTGATASRTTPPAQPRGRRLLEDRSWLLWSIALASSVLVFVALVALTALAGGDGYPH